eukprot:729753_1
MNTEMYAYMLRILDSHFIREIRSAKCGEEFEFVEVFQVGTLNWNIALYPNGMDEEDEGFCGVFVELLGMPSSWKSIFCQVHIECPQMQNKMVFLQSYNEPTSWG